MNALVADGGGKTPIGGGTATAHGIIDFKILATQLNFGVRFELHLMQLREQVKPNSSLISDVRVRQSFFRNAS